MERDIIVFSGKIDMLLTRPQKPLLQVLCYGIGIHGILVFSFFNTMMQRATRPAAPRVAKAGDTKMEFTFIPYMFLQGLATKLTGVFMCIVSVYFYLTGSMPLLYAIIMIAHGMAFTNVLVMS